eukprot:940543-Heterocapsa_arctica.AAC.1
MAFTEAAVVPWRPLPGSARCVRALVKACKGCSSACECSRRDDAGRRGRCGHMPRSDILWGWPTG